MDSYRIAPPIIEMRDVSKQFGRATVIDHISLSVAPGTIYGFVGPSGSGKTTVIRLLTGVYGQSGGDVSVLGKAPTRWQRREREKVGYMPQSFVLYPTLSVSENVDFAASTYGMGWWARRRPKRELLKFVGLWDDRHKLASSISGGMQRRLELVCTLIHNPDLLFLDEPTAGIDPVLRASIWEHLERLRQENKTLFVTTQYVTEAEYCDRVGLINEGRLIADGTPEDLRRQAYGGQVVSLAYGALNYDLLSQVEAMPEVVDGSIRRLSRETAQMVVDDAGTAIPLILRRIEQAGIPMESVRITEETPPFDDVFVRLIEQDRSQPDEPSAEEVDHARAA
ncbi:MAG: ABC transporter ATP-binding protein [Anaerolineae bacterium]